MQQIIVTLIAAIISGVLATIITLAINSYQETMRTKRALVDDIFGFKYQLANNPSNNILDIYSNGLVRALNRITIVFNKDEKVLRACDELFSTLQIANEREREIKSNEAIITLLKELCKASHIKCKNWNDSRFNRTFGTGKMIRQ